MAGCLDAVTIDVMHKHPLLPLTMQVRGAVM